MIALSANSCEEKYSRLVSLLQSKKRLAVAFSGGVDSTLLLYAAIDALGVDNVLALNASSCFEKETTKTRRRENLKDNFPSNIKYIEVLFAPLEIAEIRANTRLRCYHCKKRIYRLFQKEALQAGYQTLADGTNLDDLSADRPGLQAIAELEMITPLAETRMTKGEIRLLAKEKGLTNHDLASESCLATRLAHGQKLDLKTLNFIDKSENFMEKLGFTGVRVRLLGDRVELELQERSFFRICDQLCRKELSGFFEKHNVSNVLVKLLGRP